MTISISTLSVLACIELLSKLPASSINADKPVPISKITCFMSSALIPNNKLRKIKNLLTDSIVAISPSTICLPSLLVIARDIKCSPSTTKLKYLLSLLWSIVISKFLWSASERFFTNGLSANAAVPRFLIHPAMSPRSLALCSFARAFLPSVISHTVPPANTAVAIEPNAIQKSVIHANYHTILKRCAQNDGAF